MTNRTQALEGEHLPARGTPLPVKRPHPLKTLRDVRREMARVYGECRRGTLNAADGSKLVYTLSQIGRIITDEKVLEIEQRMAALEARK